MGLPTGPPTEARPEVPRRALLECSPVRRRRPRVSRPTERWPTMRPTAREDTDEDAGAGLQSPLGAGSPASGWGGGPCSGASAGGRVGCGSGGAVAGAPPGDSAAGGSAAGGSAAGGSAAGGSAAGGSAVGAVAGGSGSGGSSTHSPSRMAPSRGSLGCSASQGGSSGRSYSGGGRCLGRSAPPPQASARRISKGTPMRRAPPLSPRHAVEPRTSPQRCFLGAPSSKDLSSAVGLAGPRRVARAARVTGAASPGEGRSRNPPLFVHGAQGRLEIVGGAIPQLPASPRVVHHAHVADEIEFGRR